MVNPPPTGTNGSVGTGKLGYKFSKNSWHAKLNKFIYGKWYLEGVDCLCPYFWGTILAGILLPLWLIGRGIGWIIDRVPSTNIKRPRLNISDRTKHIIGKVLGYSALFGFVTFITVAFGLFIIEFGIIHVLFWLGVGAGVIGASIGLAYVVIKIKERYEDWRYNHPKEKKPNLFIEMVKAKKNKHCPLVQWD